MVCPDTAPLQNLAVSPGLTLRPSLSACGVDCTRVPAGLRVSPGLTLRPSLSEPSLRDHPSSPFTTCVAGVDAPAFVERLTPYHAFGRRGMHHCVAGVDAPAFVERAKPASEEANEACDVSPGLTLRPSLSVRASTAPELLPGARCVAGVDAPAFVERDLVRAVNRVRCTIACVAGVDAPAFVERDSDAERAGISAHVRDVSPGLTLRPSLSERGRDHHPVARDLARCRRG